MATICSRDLFPELVMTVNSTRFPEESRSVLPSRRKPACASRRSAAADSYCGTGSEAVNEKWYAVETVPKAGRSRPPKTTRDRSARMIAVDVAIALNIESNGIEIGQRFTILVFFPIISVSPEKDGGAGRVLRDIKGPENGHLLFGGMSGENRDLIEEAFETSHRSREGDNDCVGGRRLDNNLA